MPKMLHASGLTFPFASAAVPSSAESTTAPYRPRRIAPAVPDRHDPPALTAISDTRAILERAGLGPIRAIDRASYQAAAPPHLWPEALGAPRTRAIVVVASGGRGHWAAFLRWLTVDPASRLARERHPMDRFAGESLDAAAAALRTAGEEALVVQPTMNAAIVLDFVRLGVLAGLGSPSRVGVLISPHVGTWLALRGALFTSADWPIDATSPESPCIRCPAPCVAACPAALPAEASFPWQTCFDTRKREPACETACGARAACPVGAEHRYDPLEVLYHYHREKGRSALCARFGVADEIGGVGQMG